MILHLDEFDEGESRKTIRVDVGAPQVTDLLGESGYRGAAKLAGELDANLVGSSVRVRGPLSVEVEYDCGRCLETKRQSLELDAEFVLMEKSVWASKYEGDDELELSDDDMDVSFYHGEEVDLAPLIREAVLLELPVLPRCPDSDRETCDQAYRQNVGDVALEKLEEASMDQRWAALKDIKLKD